MPRASENLNRCGFAASKRTDLKATARAAANLVESLQRGDSPPVQNELLDELRAKLKDCQSPERWPSAAEAADVIKQCVKALGPSSSRHLRDRTAQRATKYLQGGSY